MKRRVPSLNVSTKLLIASLLWLGLITTLHYRLNAEPDQKRRILMGYMPVITNLAAPLIDAASESGPIRFQAMKFSSFAEMGEAFRSGHIQAAFIIAPLAVALYEQGVALKVVYIGNRHESTLVIRKDLGCTSLSCLQGKTIAVPLRFSGHYLAIIKAMAKQGLDAKSIKIVELGPPDMPSALISGGIDGYFVGEPFAAKSISAGASSKLLYAEDIWPEFICNLMIVRDDLIDAHPDWVQKLVASAARSGLWAREHSDEAIRIVCRYWGQDPQVVRYAFDNPPGRIRFDLFCPKAGEIEEIAREMQRAGLIENTPEIGGMIDDRFARKVKTEDIASLAQIVPR